MAVGKCSSLNVARAKDSALSHKRNVKRADSPAVGRLPFAKLSGKSGWKVNGTRLFGSFQRKISGSNQASEKVVLFFRTEYSKPRVQFLQIKPYLIPVSGLALVIR